MHKVLLCSEMDIDIRYRDEELKVAWDLYNDSNDKYKQVIAQKQAISEIKVSAAR